MPFSLAILAASLWALSSEMVEDAFVDLSYSTLFGWANLLKGMALSGMVLLGILLVLVRYALGEIGPVLSYIKIASAFLLVAIGIYWLIASLGGGYRIFDELNEVRKKATSSRSLLLVTQLTMVEELEIMLIVLPLVLSYHAIEAGISTTFGIMFSLAVAALLRKRFERVLIRRFRYFKLVSGLTLLIMAALIFFE
ncbi:MAG: hypothetical protein JRN68_00385 [Nitrososphaerota archaeon]|nr:hypothetical protein [Nitrososphaerota archaeon]